MALAPQGKGYNLPGHRINGTLTAYQSLLKGLCSKTLPELGLGLMTLRCLRDSASEQLTSASTKQHAICTPLRKWICQ